MKMINETSVEEFILLGFGVTQRKRLLLLILFTLLYVLTLAENITIITLVLLDAHLARLPMYILLGNFSWLEICYVTATVPRMLLDLPLPHGVISFHACFFQFYVFFSLGATECFFLSAMALDRYLAICHPLRYSQIMSNDSCYNMVVACWIFGFLWNAIPVTLISNLSFCGSNIIDHFVCDPGPILFLACPPLGSTPCIMEIFTNTLIIGNICFVAMSYSVVIVTLMKISSQGSRRKAFSTISVHLLVVAVFYGSVVAMYLTPGGEGQSEVTKVVTIFYTAVTPFPNPLIYCLRNDQVKEAVGRLWKSKEKGKSRKVTV